MEISYKYYTLELILRLFCGVIFLFQGYDKLFKVKISGVIDAFRFEAQQKNIPSFALSLMAYYTSYCEFIGGLLLIVGLFKNYALLALGLDMVLVAAAFEECGWFVVKDTNHVPGLKDNWQTSANGIGNHVFVLEKL